MADGVYASRYGCLGEGLVRDLTLRREPARDCESLQQAKEYNTCWEENCGEGEDSKAWNLVQHHCTDTVRTPIYLPGQKLVALPFFVLSGPAGFY